MNMPRELTTKQNVAKFHVLCYDMVNEVNAHILFGCEVGGKQEGFGAVGVEVYDILSQPFGEDVLVQSQLNYMSVCGFSYGDVRAEFIEETCMVHWLGVNEDVPAVITCFGIHAGGASQPAVYVVAANLHIVCGRNPPSISTRQSIVKQLRVFLEEFTAPTAGMPIIRLIVGGDNLSTREAKEALQQGRDTDLLWEVYSAVIRGRGDHVAVTGATARFIPIAVGMHFHNRGMRCDQHDALCVELSVRGASQPAKKRPTKRLSATWKAAMSQNHGCILMQ